MRTFQPVVYLVGKVSTPAFLLGALKFPMRGSVFSLLLAALYSAFGSTPAVHGIDWAKKDKEFAAAIQPILKQACLDCHSGAEAEGGLALSHFQTAKSILKERSTWQKVLQRIELGDMPPQDATPLEKEAKQKLVDWIRSTINDIECGLTPNPGSVTLRRLNRAEYQNTIRDLLGVDYKPASGFPGDDVGYGFDNIGDVLALPPVLMEKYVRAAEEISEQAIMAPEPGPVYESIIKLADVEPQGGGKYDGRQILFYSNGKISFQESLPWRGSFRIEMGLSGTPAGDAPPKLRVLVDDKKVEEVDVVTEPKGTVQTYSVSIKGTGKKANTITLEFFNDFYIAAKDGKPAQDRNLSIHDVKVLGKKDPVPLVEATLSDTHKRLVRTKPDVATSVTKAAEECLRPIASRAYRRPVKPDELARLAELVADTVESGESFEGALRVGLQAILVSPHFLFKVESPPIKKGNEYPLLSDFELATRLSYFLWSSMPDAELLATANQGKLRDPEVLKKQIQRMLADRRAAEFVENFAGQWLNLRKLEQFQPNQNLFPQWNDEIRTLARNETYHFVLHLLRNDESVLRLLDADYTFLNEKLARFYGIPGVEGEKFRMVSTKGHKRMGILTHASVLAVTSNPTRTSPVKRGKWILDNLLGTPPPPAPPGVPELEKTELTGTLRQRMEQHRADPSCAGCHRLMDPLGLALENYDAVGRWRTQERGAAIDTSGELPSGDVVKGPGDLIRNLKEKNGPTFTRCVTEKLLTYALGRGLEYYDRCAVDKMMVAAEKNDYRFTTLIFEIVSSDPFQRKGERDEL